MSTWTKWAPRAALLCLLMMAPLVCGGDAAVIRFVHRSMTPALDDFFDAVSETANALALSIVTLCALGVSSAAKAWPSMRVWLPRWDMVRQASLLMLLTLLTGGLVTLALKHLVARARPSELIEFAYYGLCTPFSGAPFNSFPSSHAFTAFTAAWVLAYFMPAWRISLIVLATAVAICRVLTLEHFPSDVLASAFVAAACVRLWAPRLSTPFSGRQNVKA